MEYNQIKAGFDVKIPSKFTLSVLEAVRNGTSLPKGHGDLIDREELLKLPLDKANYPSNYIKYVLTIVKADRSEEE